MRERDRDFCEYFDARVALMRRTAYLLYGDWHRAEDLVQTALVKLYVACAARRGRGRLRAAGSGTDRDRRLATLVPAIATAAELKVNWLSNRPADASNPRARELSDVIAAGNVLPAGMQAIRVPAATVEPLTFYVSQGAYKLSADLVDAAGEGNLFVSIGPPAAGHDTASCDGLAGCELITMPNGRKAAVLRDTEFDGTVTLLTVSTITADGTQIDVTSRNLSERASGSGKNPPRPQPTRPEPPLDLEALVRDRFNCRRRPWRPGAGR